MKLHRIFTTILTSLLAIGIGAGPLQDSVLVNAASPSVLEADPTPGATTSGQFDYTQIPAYAGAASVLVNNNLPFFTDTEKMTWGIGTEYYSPMDPLGRCGVAYACVGREIMPAEGEVRGEIGMVKPSGWQTVKYPDVIADRYLYNRCHLIGWQLGNENANTQNLITGTRYMNVDGMLPYENLIADYVKSTNHHVMYRVTPYFVGNELVARGVLLEAQSIEDNQVQFCVWCYNVQPCIEIDYATGASRQIGTAVVTPTPTPSVSASIPAANQQPAVTAPANRTGNEYILNTRSHKVHLPGCASVRQMAEHNKQTYFGTPDELRGMGYTACGNCHPF